MDLIQNRESDDDGFIRTIIHGIEIEVYGVPPKITINCVPDSVVIIWKGGVLQSVKNIDGPWIDVTVGGPRFLFLRSILPAKFFSVRGQATKRRRTAVAMRLHWCYWTVWKTLRLENYGCGAPVNVAETETSRATHLVFLQVRVIPQV